MISSYGLSKIRKLLKDSDAKLMGSRLEYSSSGKGIELNSDSRPNQLVYLILSNFPRNISSKFIAEQLGMDEKRVSGIAGPAKSKINNNIPELEMYSIRGKRTYGVRKVNISAANNIVGERIDSSEFLAKTDVSLFDKYYLVGKDEIPHLRTPLNDGAMLEFLAEYAGQKINVRDIAYMINRSVSDINVNMLKLNESLNDSHCIRLIIGNSKSTYGLEKYAETDFSVGPAEPKISVDQFVRLMKLTKNGLEYQVPFSIKNSSRKNSHIDGKYNGELFMYLQSANGRWVEKEYLASRMGKTVAYVSSKLSDMKKFFDNIDNYHLDSPKVLGITRLRRV